MSELPTPLPLLGPAPPKAEEEEPRPEPSPDSVNNNSNRFFVNEYISIECFKFCQQQQQVLQDVHLHRTFLNSHNDQPRPDSVNNNSNRFFVNVYISMQHFNIPSMITSKGMMNDVRKVLNIKNR
jgi:hypothetical protein